MAHERGGAESTDEGELMERVQVNLAQLIIAVDELGRAVLVEMIRRGYSVEHMVSAWNVVGMAFDLKAAMYLHETNEGRSGGR